MGQMLPQQLGDFRRRLKPVVRFLRQQAVDDGHQPLRNVRVDLANGAWIVVAHTANDGHHGIAPKRGAAGTHCVQHAAQTEQVGPMVDLFILSLFGGHVLRSS